MDVEEEEEEKKSEEPSKEEDDEYRETVEEPKREPENNDYDFDETEVDWNEQDGDQPMEVEAPNDVEESDDDGEEDHPFLLIFYLPLCTRALFRFQFSNEHTHSLVADILHPSAMGGVKGMRAVMHVYIYMPLNLNIMAQDCQ